MFTLSVSTKFYRHRSSSKKGKTQFRPLTSADSWTIPARISLKSTSKTLARTSSFCFLTGIWLREWSGPWTQSLFALIPKMVSAMHTNSSRKTLKSTIERKILTIVWKKTTIEPPKLFHYLSLRVPLFSELIRHQMANTRLINSTHVSGGSITRWETWCQCWYVSRSWAWREMTNSRCSGYGQKLWKTTAFSSSKTRFTITTSSLIILSLMLGLMMISQISMS